MWNVPLMVIKNIKEILDKSCIDRPFEYSKWITKLNEIKLEDTYFNSNLLDKSLALLKDEKTDYHIMNLEGLLKFETTEDEQVFLNVNEKMNIIYNKLNFEEYRYLYRTDINKKKKLLVESIKYVSASQVGNLVIFKYRPEVTYYDLWNEFYKETRGLVIDLEDMELVSTPYRKFFNLNEKEETRLERILELIKKAVSVLIKNKEDGSMISVSKYKNEIVVATPGSLESSQSKWAKDFLYKHYPRFIETMPEGATFIFEAIYPENRIVVDYKGREDLILTNIRDKMTGRLIPENIVERIAKVFDIRTPSKEKGNLEDIITQTGNRELYPADQKEGWVFVIRTESEDILFKLKCDDYCELHKIMALVTSPKIVFNSIKSDKFDDLISKVPDNFKGLVMNISEIIFNHIKETEVEVNNYLKLINKEDIYTEDELYKNDKFINVLKQEVISEISDKLSRGIKNEIETALINKSFGKEPSFDKWTMKEFERLWSLIPMELKNQKSFKKKQGKLLGIIKKNIPSKYQYIAFDYVEGKSYNFIDSIDLKDINFDTIIKDISKFQDEE